MWLLIGDTHFTDNQRDAYRFGLFDWIKHQQAKYPVAATYFAGDLCDAKDRHSASLVNKVVAGLLKLKPPIYICKGNHDYRDPHNPFFKFLNNIPGISFVVTPTVCTVGASMAVIPHVRSQEEFDQSVRDCNASGTPPECYLVHQTFDGAIAETGTRLTGLSASPIELLKPRLGVYAGDVHRPQRSGIVTYLGCPYHVRFGDSYDPSCLYVDSKMTETKLWFDAPHKWSIRIRDSVDIRNNKDLLPGDQIKLTVELHRDEVPDWGAIKAAIQHELKAKELHIHGIKLEVAKTKLKKLKLKAAYGQKEIFDNYCTSAGVHQLSRSAGLQLLESKKHRDDFST